jgi:magnesium-protoporphyrin IX monomethyl ester (oxidative) cyclase
LFVSRKGEKTRFMFSSRGCLYDCNFCVCHDSRQYRVRAPSNVVNEMESLVARYDARHINFLDALFIGKKERVLAICDEIKKRRISVGFVIEAHVNLVSPEMLEALKSAGCYGIYYGLESGNDEVLRRVRKGSRVARSREAVQWTKDAGLKIMGFFMLGMPGETIRTMQDTLNLAKSLPLDLAQFGLMVPYPGSALYDTLAQEGKIRMGENIEETLALWERFSPHAAFSGREPVFAPEGMTAEQIVDFQRRAIRSYYLRPREIIRYLGRVNRRNAARLAREGLKLFFG